MEFTPISKRDLGNIIQTTIHISNKDKSFITTDEIKQIVDRFENKGAKVMMRGLNIERWMDAKNNERYI